MYEALAGRTVRFADEPLASGGGAQAIRPPDQVLAVPGHGNCLDLSVAFAGACLHAGLHPLIVVCDPPGGGPAHAVVVVWLGDDWPGAGGADTYEPPAPPGEPAGTVLGAPPRWPGGLRETVDGPGRFLPVDVTRVAAGFHDGPASFADAVVQAARVLTEAAAGDPGGWRWGFGVDVGCHYRPQTALAVPEVPAVRPLVAPYLDSAAQRGGPLADLKARNGRVPFQPRRELDQLLGWCRAEQPQQIRIAVVEGPGGAGKTHLAAEVAKRLAGEGWYTGFLARPHPSEAAQKWLVQVLSPLLVVIDYVDAQSTAEVSTLVQVLANRRARTVLLFTTRHRGDWSEQLDQQLSQANVVVSRYSGDALVLPARHPSTLGCSARRTGVSPAGRMPRRWTNRSCRPAGGGGPLWTW